MDEYINFFKDLDASLGKDFKKVNIEFQIEILSVCVEGAAEEDI